MRSINRGYLGDAGVVDENIDTRRSCRCCSPEIHGRLDLTQVRFDQLTGIAPDRVLNRLGRSTALGVMQQHACPCSSDCLDNCFANTARTARHQHCFSAEIDHPTIPGYVTTVGILHMSTKHPNRYLALAIGVAGGGASLGHHHFAGLAWTANLLPGSFRARIGARDKRSRRSRWWRPVRHKQNTATPHGR